VALTDYYVSDSGNNGNGGTSWGDAWATPEYALDTGIVAQGAGGDRLNIRGSHTLSKNLATCAYFGSYTPSITKPFWFRGEGAASSILDGNASASVWASTTLDHIVFSALTARNTGANPVLQFDDYGSVWACKIHGSTNERGIDADQFLTVLNCEVYGCGGNYAIFAGQGYAVVSGCYVHPTDATPTNRMIGVSSAAVVERNIVVCSGTSGIYNSGTSTCILHNTIWSTGGAANEIGINTDGVNSLVIGNIVAGLSGVGCTGIDQHSTTSLQAKMIARNAVYNCTTPYNASVTANCLFLEDNETLTGGNDPLPNAGSGNFTPADVGNVKGLGTGAEGGWPDFALWLAANPSYPWKGAIQPAGGSGGAPVLINGGLVG